MTATMPTTATVVGAAIFSEQPAELAGFYARLFGLSLEQRRHADGREHWICELGSVHFEIKATRQDDGSPTPDAVVGSTSHSSIELSFRVDDAAGVVEQAVALGATLHQPLEHHRWGAFAVVLDPDGNRLGVYTPPNPDDSPEGD